MQLPSAFSIASKCAGRKRLLRLDVEDNFARIHLRCPLRLAHFLIKGHVWSVVVSQNTTRVSAPWSPLWATQKSRSLAKCVLTRPIPPQTELGDPDRGVCPPFHQPRGPLVSEASLEDIGAGLLQVMARATRFVDARVPACDVINKTRRFRLLSPFLETIAIPTLKVRGMTPENRGSRKWKRRLCHE